MIRNVKIGVIEFVVEGTYSNSTSDWKSLKILWNFYNCINKDFFTLSKERLIKIIRFVVYSEDSRVYTKRTEQNYKTKMVLLN